MANYILLDSIKISGDNTASSITFSNIPQTGFTDLKLVYSLRNNTNIAYKYEHPQVTVNGGVAGKYAAKMLYGTGGTILSADDSAYTSNFGYWAGLFNSADTASNTFSSNELYFPNYTSSYVKSFYTTGGTGNTTSGAGNWGISQTASAWNQTTAISSITLTCTSGAWVAGSSVAMYGIAATGTTPTDAKAYGGDTVITDGTYWYHTFLSSGTFTPMQALTCDYLVVGGGGGGAGSGADGYASAGGGAGGYRTSIGGSPISVTAQSYAITVGAGGAGGITINGNTGNSSIFSTITAAGGGYGGAGTSAGGNGGSGGGGAGGSAGGTGNTPSVSPSQGNNGGVGYSPGPVHSGGGGGGAGATGSAGTSSGGGNGGIGSNSASALASATKTGVSGYFAGGGGGGVRTSYTAGTGGTGGGGNGTNGDTGDAFAGTPNTGGGGGGAGSQLSTGRNLIGGNGGSGIVIVRYAV